MAGKCFVLMPFKDPFNNLYKEIFEQAIKDVGLKPVRADEIYSTRPIIEDIFREIGEATALIADVTGKNPNVNYELGIAHTLELPVVIISQSMEDIPFDYRHYRAYIYEVTDTGKQKLQDDITKALSEILQERRRITDPFGRWEGWYKEPDEPKWWPTAHEIQQKGNKIVAIAYGQTEDGRTNKSESICTYVDKDKHGKCRLIWTYDSKTIKGLGDLPDHTGTHIASFTTTKDGKKLMDGAFYNNRKQKNDCIGAVGEFNCLWVSNDLKHGVAYESDNWPPNRGL